jgi:hypothetical protein
MKFFICYAVAITVVASALVVLGSDCSFAGKSRSVAVKVSQAPSQPVKLRYYGGPKSPMYP